jgi:hypothetical protein
LRYPTNDPDDRSIFEIAATQHVDFIVSHDMRDVHAFADASILNGATIVDAEQFLTNLNERIRA